MAQDPEIMKIQPSNNPGMSLTSIPLDGSNFLTWSRSVKISLGAKMKLSFINGKIKKPEESDQTYEQWIRADYMVTSWILNSISKEIVESFLYTTTARELWTELETRFGQGNEPMIYQLKREISSIAQGTMSVSAYFSRSKRLWDELTCLHPMPQCSCGASKEVAVLNNEDQLMQFLMGLSDSYDNNGHTKEVCFEIYGYPEWYKNLVEQRKKDGASTSRTFVAANTQEQAQNAVDELTMSEMIRTEIQRYMGDTGSTVTENEDYLEFSEQQNNPITSSIPVCIEDTEPMDIHTPTEIQERTDSDLTPQNEEPITTTTLRRSSRVINRPAYLQDFECSMSTLASDFEEGVKD
ncbi:UNVERIFIED_CONTAM: hypothetical protein Slati_0518700 [Sesamum latifolium]|uniref:Retrotransposon Copia-like N-terminal domain-containing protein n=1 Tax=Sesamum latifolium TaxID=2727402 RepID=A0AAW2XZ42_9LAMI